MNETDIISGFSIANDTCAGCGKPLLIDNAWMTDGCPCNSPLGVNSMNETRWRLLMQLQQRQSLEMETIKKGEIAVNKWGSQLFEAMGKFIEEAAKASGPRSVKILCSFNDVPEFPVLHLWASNDGTSPIARNAELRQQITDRDREIMRIEAERDGLAKFKAYVHQRLDEAGVPADPDSPHKAEGCRIGGRLDIVLAKSRLAWIEAAANECASEVLVGAGRISFARIIEKHFDAAK